MKKTKTVRAKWLTIRLSEEEEKTLQKLYGRTTSSSLSEYARAVLLGAPVTVLYRNQTADDFLGEMIGLKKELNGIANNFNHSAHRLPTPGQIPELRAWAFVNETGKKALLNKIEEIQHRMSQIYELWSQK